MMVVEFTIFANAIANFKDTYFNSQRFIRVDFQIIPGQMGDSTSGSLYNST